MSDQEFAEKAVWQVIAEAAAFAAMWERELQLDAMCELARATRGSSDAG